MRFISAAFFSWIQAAPFYIDVHAQAVALLPQGNGKTWLDVGCGPGLIARLASEREYTVLGIDRDPDMVHFAVRNTRANQSCRFEVGDLSGISGQQLVDVVSATSLLFVVPDASVAIKQLWAHVRPGGKLLVIETTELMTPKDAWKVKSITKPGRHLVLALWSWVRYGRSIDLDVFQQISAYSCECVLLLGGLVQAWIFTKESA